jgi:hypothetical protein
MSHTVCRPVINILSSLGPSLTLTLRREDCHTKLEVQPVCQNSVELTRFQTGMLVHGVLEKPAIPNHRTRMLIAGRRASSRPMRSLVTPPGSTSHTYTHLRNDVFMASQVCSTTCTSVNMSVLIQLRKHSPHATSPKKRNYFRVDVNSGSQAGQMTLFRRQNSVS